jgi:hypothetical protein
LEGSPVLAPVAAEEGELVTDDHAEGGDWAIAGELTQLMREMDEGFFCTDDARIADRYWLQYLEPEIERLFSPEVSFHSHFQGPGGRSHYTGYAGVRRWADDIVEVFSRFTRRNGDWQPLGPDALLANQHIEARRRDGSADIDLHIWVLWLIDDGQVVALRSFTDRYEAEAAAGSARLAAG